MTAITVKGIPEDLASFILKIQGELKQKKVVGQLHQGVAVIHIIREYKKIVDLKAKATSS